MKKDRYLRGLYARSNPQRRAASELRTPLLIAAGLIGVPLAIGLAYRASEDDPAPTVDAATSYPMNHFLPGAGYYHAPYHAWFPMPFNYYDAHRGWFRGGQWRPAATEDEAERKEEERTGAFTSSGSHGGYLGGSGRLMSSRPAPAAVEHANAGAAEAHAHVIRGGFGSSARPGIS